MSAFTQSIARIRAALVAGDWRQAESLGREAVRKHPRDAEPLYLLGSALLLGGNAMAALPYLRRAAQAVPERGEVHRALAQALATAGLLDAAHAAASDAVRVDPASADGWTLLGVVQQRTGQFEQAADSFAIAVQLAPSEASAHNNLANLLVETGRLDEAIRVYRAALALEPDFADAWANLGAALLLADRATEAADACREALRCQPRHAPAWHTLGNALLEESRWTDARDAFDRILALDPLSLAARYNRSLAELALGMPRGWDDYRLRHTVEPTVRVDSGLPRWAGESLAGKTILVRREQGIGTQVMFAGYLPLLANSAERLVVECDPRLRSLLVRSAPGVAMLTSGELFIAPAGEADVALIEWKIPRPDVETAIGDLPGLLHRDESPHGSTASAGSTDRTWCDAALPARLQVDEALVRKWRGRLAALGAGVSVGISWRGGGTAASRRKRSTTLADWQPVFATRGVRFVSLQYEDQPGEIDRELQAAYEQGAPHVHRWADFGPRNDLDDLAALCVALDAVITIDNSTAHLAGAVGANAWILLPSAADWRWLEQRTDSPWYPSVELIRQTTPGDWADVFERTAARLSRLESEARRKGRWAG